MTVPTTAPVDTRSLIDEVLGTMTAVGEGVAGAQDKLAKEAAKAKAPAATPAPVSTGPAPAPIKATGKSVVRPNGEQYFIRKINGQHDDVPFLQRSREKKMPILFFGLPGCGKTALFEAAFSAGFEYVPGTGDTMVSDFEGGYVPTGDKDDPYEWVDGPLIRAMDRGVPLLVDEIALIDPKVMAVVYSVMDGRGVLNVTSNPRRGEVKAMDGFVVYGACNPNAPGARMSEALLSRFKIHVEVSVDFALLKKMGVNGTLITCVTNMKTKFDKRELGWYPQIREMLAFEEIAREFGIETALSNLVSIAPENERKDIADLLTRAFAQQIKGLMLK